MALVVLARTMRQLGGVAVFPSAVMAMLTNRNGSCPRWLRDDEPFMATSLLSYNQHRVTVTEESVAGTDSLA